VLTTRKSGWPLALALFCVLAWAAPGIAQPYTLTDLGTLSGNSVSKAAALNNAGEAAGVSETPTAAIATMFNGGSATNISAPGSSVSLANAINRSGEIAGWMNGSTANFDPQAFLYSNGSVKNINSPSLFPSGTEAYGINNSGEVVGTGYLSPSNFHAFLYTGGKMTDIGPPGSLQASADAINNSGQIVGSYYLTAGGGGAFLYSSGKITTLPVPADSAGVSALAINDNGEIAGALYPISGGASHAARYANGVWTDLGTIAGAASNVGMGINISGRVVGTAIFPQTQYHPPKPGKHVPVISTIEGLINLNDLIPAGTGFTLTDAVAINDSGQILCDATNSNGNEHAVLLSPK
jgi:probable HAF family extracellular repeat protein